VFIFEHYIVKCFFVLIISSVLYETFHLLFCFCVQVVLHVHHARQPARVDQLVSLLDPKKGTVLRQRPRHLTANQSAIVEVCHLFPSLVGL